MTDKSFNSFTLSFDHFAPEDYTHGYVALYKRANESQWQQEKGKTYKFEISVKGDWKKCNFDPFKLIFLFACTDKSFSEGTFFCTWYSSL